MFDRDWYCATCPDAEAEADPLRHFCSEGWRQGLQPNAYFETGWYAKTYGDELLDGENPLLHYIRRGERENAWPSLHFDPEWYRDTYAIGEQSPLGHYLRNRGSGEYSPLPDFDVASYVAAHPEYPDSGLDPYFHWRTQPEEEPASLLTNESPLAQVIGILGGNLERDEIPEMVTWDAVKQALELFVPHIPVDAEWYCREYPDVDAAVKCGEVASAKEHFIEWGFFEGRHPGPVEPATEPG